MSGPEYNEVERPFLKQLNLMGWECLTGDPDRPSVNGRETYREVLLRAELDKALRRINLRDGEPWLDDARVSQAVGALDRIGHQQLMEANQEATGLLLNGIAVEGLPDWEQGRGKTVHFIDWDSPENNVFTAVNQFRVDCPGGQAKEFIVPDIVLFVNGIPVVVVECKSPTVSEPIPAAIDQLRRYHNARKAAGEVEENEGNERLFYTNQFLVATCYDEARFGTVGAEMAHYLEWKDTAPVPLEQVKVELGKEILSSQNKLIAGMLRPAHLLDIIQHFALYQQVSGKTVKIVGRYQQFRAVQNAIHRLQTGKTREQDGEHVTKGEMKMDIKNEPPDARGMRGVKVPAKRISCLHRRMSHLDRRIGSDLRDSSKAYDRAELSALLHVLARLEYLEDAIGHVSGLAEDMAKDAYVTNANTISCDGCGQGAGDREDIVHDDTCPIGAWDDYKKRIREQERWRDADRTLDRECKRLQEHRPVTELRRDSDPR